jgi:hypothetical protein
MRSILIIGIIATIGIFSSCSKQGLELKEGNVEIYLKKCADGKLSETNYKLCFDELISDSRCPANAMCVWQGTAVAKFSLTKDHDTYSFILSTVDLPGTYHKDTTLFGYKIEFVNLLPYPGTVPSPIPSDQIKAELKITKL